MDAGEDWGQDLPVAPTREQALDRLRRFVAGPLRGYATCRNADPGPGSPQPVSGLSPFIRTRLVREWEVVKAAVDAYSPATVQMFVQEVFWRTYWKGWMEMRPTVWLDWQQQVRRDLDRVESRSASSSDYRAAVTGTTGIDCFDAWVRELTTRNTLHNHARMWFASIWIFTLRLPWSLGAAFFWKHLLDGDPASNTLSWRWVAGLHTRGKAYVARADNIAHWTGGRFHPQGQLNETAQALEGWVEWPRVPMDLGPESAPDSPWVLWLTGEDLSPETCPPWRRNPPQAVVVPTAGPETASGTHPSFQVDAPVRVFRERAMEDTVLRLGRWLGPTVPVLRLPSGPFDPDSTWAWIRKQTSARSVVSPYPPVGPWADWIQGCRRSCPMPWHLSARSWDRATWPWATSGYFRFRSNIPIWVDRLADLE